MKVKKEFKVSNENQSSTTAAEFKLKYELSISYSLMALAKVLCLLAGTWQRK